MKKRVMSGFGQSRKASVGNSLSVWAIKLGKDQRTIRRYVQSGVIPEAFQTRGGQWRAPYTPAAYKEVVDRLKGFSRSRSSYGLNLRMYASEAQRLTNAYVFLKAFKRERLNELRILRVFWWFLDRLSNEKGRRILSRARKRSRLWHACVRVAGSETRRGALVAAYSLALAEMAAETRDEAAVLYDFEKFRPFGKSPVGEAFPGVKFPRRVKSSGRSTISLRQRSRIVGNAKRTVPLRELVQKWQWINGRVSIQSAPIQFIEMREGRRLAVSKPQKYLSSRTFFNWYRGVNLKAVEEQVAHMLDFTPPSASE